jgi:hypothetical protein
VQKAAKSSGKGKGTDMQQFNPLLQQIIAESYIDNQTP